jgi:hypothetical protein
MTWIDNIFNSSLLVYAIILFGLISLYLKKTGKTFLEMCQDIKEFLKKIMGGKNE